MPRPLHRDEARRFVIGVVTVVVLGIVAAVGVLAQGGGRLPAKRYTYVAATFNDVGTLARLNNVTQDGIRIGQVDGVEYVHGRSVVTMRLDGHRNVYGNATAAIGNFSALGRKMVRLDPGTADAGPLGPSGIPASRTNDSQTLDDVLSAFDPEARRGLGTTLKELGSGVVGHGPGLNDFVSNSEGIVTGVGDATGALADPRAQVPELLVAADQLAGRFRHREDEISSLLQQAGKTLDAVNVDDAEPLAATVDKLPATLQEANSALSDLEEPLADLRVTLEDVRPGASALGSSTGELRGFLRESGEPLDRLPGVSKLAVPAVASLTETLGVARPLVAKLPPALDDSAVLLDALSPYAPDIGRFVSEHDLLSGNYGPDKHYFSAMLTLPGLYSASLPDSKADPYPAPGYGAWDDNPTAEGSK